MGNSLPVLAVVRLMNPAQSAALSSEHHHLHARELEVCLLLREFWLMMDVPYWIGMQKHMQRRLRALMELLVRLQTPALVSR